MICLAILLVFMATNCAVQARVIHGMRQVDLLRYLIKKDECVSYARFCDASSTCCDENRCVNFFIDKPTDNYPNPPCGEGDCEDPNGGKCHCICAGPIN